MSTAILPDSRPTVQYVPFFAVAPLTAEQAEAAEQADLARCRLDQHLAELHRRPAPRAPSCGRGATLHLRRDRDGGHVEDALVRLSCGRSDCPHCWRRRLTRTYRRAATCLLDEPAPSTLPRVGPLYVAETTWLAWPATDKAIRRQHGGSCGRLRVRRADNTVLIVCTQPVHGSRAVSPAEALELVTAAIDRLHTRRHAYRQLGEWSDARPSDWRRIAQYQQPLDYGAVASLLQQHRIRSRRARRPEVDALFWRAESAGDADALLGLLRGVLQPCPSMDTGRSRSSTGDTRTAAPPPEPDSHAGRGTQPPDGRRPPA